MPATARPFGRLTRLLRVGRGPSAARRWVRLSRRRAARAVVAFLALSLLGNVGFLLLLDYGPPGLRDPEYGRRLDRVKARTADHPGRPLVLVIGSSRTAMGVRPGVLDDGPGRPLVLNFALAGSGPVMELMAFRRALADGVRPAAVVVEYWPAFFREDGGYREDARIDPARLRPVDRQLVREYFLDPERTERTMREQRLLPWYGHRHGLLSQLAPSWVPPYRQTNGMWEAIDDWGWLPGRKGATAEEREAALQHTASYYVPVFQGFQVSPDADRALRQLVSECRAAGIPVALVYLPESAAFRAMMTPEAVRRSEEHLAAVRAELGVPLIDGRGWLGEEDLPDGFHPTWSGAAALTRKLAAAVVETFPGLGRTDR